MRIIQPVVYYVFIPILYLLILLFDINLIRKSEGSVARAQMSLGVFGGVIFSILVFLLDQTTNFSERLVGSPPDARNITQIWPFLAISFLGGIALILIIHLLLKAQQILPFIVMLTLIVMLVSGYFLFSLSDYRNVFALSAISFIFGIVIYFMLVPETVPLLLVGIVPGTQGTTQPKRDKTDWS